MPSWVHEGMAMKVLTLIFAAGAATPGVFESILNDPLAPCLFGALGGEIVRILWPVEASTEHIVRRLFSSVFAVVFGTVFAFYAWKAVPFMPPGLAKLCCGVVGWGIIKAMVSLDMKSAVETVWKAVVNLALAMIKSKEPKE